ncbi:MAG: ABC transporter ATP-binding protein [Aerococcus sp.]|nr:ABC transporter ATP-binding protein [Aerococcus sp.]
MLTAKHLRKTFGSVVAVDDVSFEVKDGEILGLIGRNGSGKTTIFRMILNFITPELPESEIMWNGKPMGSQVYDTIGYLPEERGLYEKMTIHDQIHYFAELRGMDPKVIDERIPQWMERFQVKGKVTDKISTLSKGNQQKVQLIGTLIHEPKFMILDEPFSGLDPVNADLLKQGILYLRDRGTSIIFSTHNMNNVEEICDSMLMIHNGVQVLYGGIEDVRNSFGKTRIFIHTDQWTAAQIEALDGVVKVTERSPHQFRLQLSDESYGPDLFETLTKGEYVQTFDQQPPTLEEIFKMEAGGSNE